MGENPACNEVWKIPNSEVAIEVQVLGYMYEESITVYCSMFEAPCEVSVSHHFWPTLGPVIHDCLDCTSAPDNIKKLF